ncbi:MAG TPA: hypothetical protein DDX40_06700 [Rikenellaceae bacterium]|nr:hypothetical protein [Rikenellaceae bacterium]
MDWTSIIVTLITSGAFTTIYFLGDRKTASVLDNVSKTIDQWRGLVDEYKNESEALRQQLADKDVKIDQLYKSIGTLRDRGDKLSSRVAYLNAFRCKKIKCMDREPPFGSVKMEDVGNGNDQ